jgi:vacuolar-type H+-ATPase subunit I/STV1
MVALGQQATQMAGTLTMMGGKWLAIGTGLGVAIPLITAAGAAFLRTRKDVDDTSESLKTLESNLDSLDKKLEDWVKTKKAASLGVTLDELFGIEGLDKAKEDLKEAQDALAALVKQAEAASLVGGSGGAFLFGATLFGDGIGAAEKEVEKAAKRLADIEAKIRQDAREEAEAELLASMEEQNRERALAEYDAGQKIIAERKAWTEEAIGIFKAAQKRMRDEDIAVTERTLQHLFRSRTLFYSIRFSGDQEVMSQSLTPSGKMKPSQSYEELIAMGWTPEDLERIGMTPPRKPRGGGGASQQDPLAKLRERIKLDTELLGKTKERQEVERAIANSSKTYGKEAVDQAVAELEAYNQIVEKRQELQGIYDTAQSSMEDGFMAMVEGTKSVEDAFKDMARNIIKELYQVYVIKRMVGGFGMDGAAGSGILGGVQKILGFDGGGYTGSGPRSGGLDGRGGFLAMMHPRETVVDHTKAGSDVGGESVTVVQNFNFQANGDESVKKIIAQAAPSIANMAKQSVMDARRRGGAMKNTFG